VPALRQRYIGYISDITKNWLTWDKIGPLAKQFQSLIAKDIKVDTHKVTSTEGFLNGLTEDTAPTITSGFSRSMRMSGSGNVISLKNFVQERARYLAPYLR